MKETTRRNVEAAFIGEAKAYFRLHAFAKKADEEGYPQIARLFRAVAEAEAVHARNHFSLLERVGTTEENLKSAFESEEFANGVAYPEFLKQAWQDDEKGAIWWFTAARNADERHARLYKHALENMIAERSVLYYVCTHCGWIEEARPPEVCPNCQKPRDYFREVS
ncbi:rubrerythrin family protein [Thermodesulforhabdus norvegica]|uniref:Rubrerythrin n=1 Tax=Thermodesulforhabdus norvegica TaxID=39841 RepID=A0A1I4UXJ6_9BACT|nr:rubrerythrin family protein [Thermodesulforhabdus norvegica]SFM93661.1 Rubrerythrin [Thermodesulforhabdus norvegica]